MLTREMLLRYAPTVRPNRADWRTQPGLHFVDGGTPEPQSGTPKAGDAPASPSPGGAPGAADPARAEREARLEADAQSYRSLKGRLREAGLDKLKPEELAELVNRGKSAADGTPKPEGDEEGAEGGPGRKTKEMLVSEHQEALRRERQKGEEKLSQTTRTLAAERDHFKGLYQAGLVDRETDVILSDEAFEDFDRANVRDALKSDRVPFRLALDEETQSLMVVDKKTGSEYRDPETKAYFTPREALAALPRFASYVKRTTLPGGGGPSSTTTSSARPASGKTDPSKLSPLGKIGQAFTGR